MATEGHKCDTCAWILRPGTDVKQHNFGLLHRTLLDASTRLTPKEFGRFRERVALDGPKKGRTCLKQVLKVAPQLTSWLRELDGFFPEQLPFGTSRIGRTCFTAMVVMENYHSTPHTDRDLSNSMISWFLEGDAESGGEFAFPVHGMFFKPRHGTIILF
ncbi:unnamed protein product [Sphagnum jensenii]|uniref:Uncharacterized protein n=1 Tax=Sphagnum jensenii TaxID=128206 RepID=A0ABP1AWK6_9BRYO